jgi:hypothetical protein
MSTLSDQHPTSEPKDGSQRIKTGTRARVKRAIRNRAGEEVRPGDIVTLAQHKVRANTVTIYRPKIGISNVELEDLEILP